MNELEVKHLKQNNKVCMIIGVIIHTFLVLAIILYARGRMLPTPLLLGVEVVSIVIFGIGYFLFKNSKKCHYPLMISFAISYLIILIGSLHTPYLWAFAVLIGSTIVIYNEKKLCLISAITVIVENIVFLMVYYMTGANNNISGVFMVPTNMAFVVLFSIILYIVVRINESQNKESMDAIKDQSAEQERVAVKIKDTADKIAARLEDANDAMTSLSEKVHTSTEAVEQISSSVSMTAEAIQTQTEMNSNIMKSLEGIADESKEMQKLSNTVKNNVDEGNDIIEELQKQANETANVNRKTAEKTRQLVEQAERVNDIISAILNISSQTNLLALNASIEAARAGEAGRGFAVVAEEIRKLSEDTKKSAEEISSTIASLIDSVSNASDNMQLSVESANTQGILIKSTGEKFAVILESVNSLAKNVEEISENVDKCADATSVVMDSISDLSATSEEVAASSESSLSLSTECVNDMDRTTSILSDILQLSRN